MQILAHRADTAASALQSLLRFAVTDLSNWYLDVIKDRLYVSAADSFDRRAAQTVLSALIEVRYSR